MPLVPASVTPTIALVALCVSLFSATVSTIALWVGGAKLKVKFQGSRKRYRRGRRPATGQPPGWTVTVHVFNTGRLPVTITNVSVSRPNDLFAEVNADKDVKFPLVLAGKSRDYFSFSIPWLPEDASCGCKLAARVEAGLKTYGRTLSLR